MNKGNETRKLPHCQHDEHHSGFLPTPSPRTDRSPHPGIAPQAAARSISIVATPTTAPHATVPLVVALFRVHLGVPPSRAALSMRRCVINALASCTFLALCVLNARTPAVPPSPSHTDRSALAKASIVAVNLVCGLLTPHALWASLQPRVGGAPPLMLHPGVVSSWRSRRTLVMLRRILPVLQQLHPL